jgi:hypothetical protein
MEPLFKIIEKRTETPKPEPNQKNTGSREQERGDMLKYFRSRLNPGRAADGFPLISMARMGKILQGIPTKDLYYLKAVCEDAERRGYSFSKRFFWEIKPR